MVGRLYRAIECCEHLATRKHPAPALKLTLYNILGDKVAENIEIPIDTGYEGPIMLPTELYQLFTKAELPRTFWRSYRTLTGTITMRAARATIKIFDRTIETFVESPYLGGGKPLIGRELLNDLTVVIDGKNRVTCLVKTEG